MRFRERFVDYYLVRSFRAWQTTDTHHKVVEVRSLCRGQRDHASTCRFIHPRDVYDDVVDDPAFHAGYAGYFSQVVQKGFCRTLGLCKHVGKPIPFIIGIASLFEGAESAKGQNDSRHTTADHKGNGDDLAANTPKVAYEFSIKGS